MIDLNQIVAALELEVASGATEMAREVCGGYASDLLSCVMHRARQGDVWVTLQSHLNIVAVASLVGLSAIVITEGKRPSEETIEKADGEGVVLLLTEKTTFEVASELATLGVGSKAETP
jgi:hypothetical protein